jgi:carboxyl-terminal processing protease
MDADPNIPKSRSNTKWILLSLVAFLVIVGSFRLGYISGARGFTIDVKRFQVINKAEVPTIVDYNLLWQALDIVQQKYIDSEHIDPLKVLYGAISGAVTAAGDDYTEFLDPETLALFKTDLQGSFSGIGAEIGIDDNSIVVIAPLAGSPAERAGIRAGDFIVSINGETTLGMNPDQAASRIRGPEGSEVTLVLFRDGQSENFEVKIVREKIELRSVELSYKEQNGKKIAVIKISRFGDDTVDLLNEASRDIQRNNPAGVIVDVRNNPGGYLDTAVEVSSQWLEEGKLVVREERSQADAVLYNSSGDNQLGRFHTVVLMNGGSASASEILAGALKDNGRAILIGEKSFGKGSVQELVPLGDAAVKVTVAKWITPSGHNIDKEGLQPDIIVEFTNEDFDAGRDPQLERALQELTK